MKKRQRYGPEFKAQAIDLLATGKPVQELAGELRAPQSENAHLHVENDIFKKPAVILGTGIPSNSAK